MIFTRGGIKDDSQGRAKFQIWFKIPKNRVAFSRSFGPEAADCTSFVFAADPTAAGNGPGGIDRGAGGSGC